MNNQEKYENQDTPTQMWQTSHWYKEQQWHILTAGLSTPLFWVLEVLEFQSTHQDIIPKSQEPQWQPRIYWNSNTQCFYYGFSNKVCHQSTWHQVQNERPSLEVLDIYCSYSKVGGISIQVSNLIFWKLYIWHNLQEPNMRQKLSDNHDG